MFVRVMSILFTCIWLCEYGYLLCHHLAILLRGRAGNRLELPPLDAQLALTLLLPDYTFVKLA